MNLCVKCDFWYFLNLFCALDLTFDPWHNPSQSNQKTTVHFLFCMNAFIDHYALLAPAIYPASSPAVYRYFSDRARATAARNLSIDTWTSGVKSLGNMVAMTTRRLWERICERRAITHMLHIWRLLNMHTGGLWPLHGLRLRKTLHHSSVSQNESLHLEVGRVHTQSEGVQLTEVQETSFQVVDLGHSVSNSSHHSPAVLLHIGRGGAPVLPVGEVSLGLRVNSQHPGWKRKTSMKMGDAFTYSTINVN